MTSRGCKAGADGAVSIPIDSSKSSYPEGLGRGRSDGTNSFSPDSYRRSRFCASRGAYVNRRTADMSVGLVGRSSRG